MEPLRGTRLAGKVRGAVQAAWQHVHVAIL